jgi:hypothetical protein
MSFKSVLAALALVPCATSLPTIVSANPIDCYGTVRSVVAQSTGGALVGISPTTQPSLNPCPLPCATTKDIFLGMTYLILPPTHPARDLIYSTALTGVVSGKPVHVAVGPPLNADGSVAASGTCTILDLELRSQ